MYPSISVNCIKNGIGSCIYIAICTWESSARRDAHKGGGNPIASRWDTPKSAA